MQDDVKICLIKAAMRVGGAEKQIVLLANNLPSEKYKVFLLCETMSPVISEMLTPNIAVVLIEAKSILGRLKEIRRFIKKSKIDIIHSFDFRSSITSFGAAFWSNMKFIDGSIRSAPSKYILQTERAFGFQRYKLLFFTFLNIPIISNSQAGLVSYNLVRYRNSMVIPNAYLESKAELRNVLKLPGDRRVVMVANMRWKKDFKTFIKAIPIVIKDYPETWFFFIGDGPDVQNYKQLTADLMVDKNCVFTGNISNVAAYLDQMDICVLCNNVSGEGQSNSIMEYMEKSKPVIATDMGGNPELIINNLNGFLINEKDHNALANKIIYLFENEDKAVKMGQEGRRKLLENHSNTKFINRYENLYSLMLGEK